MYPFYIQSKQQRYHVYEPQCFNPSLMASLHCLTFSSSFASCLGALSGHHLRAL